MTSTVRPALNDGTVFRATLLFAGLMAVCGCEEEKPKPPPPPTVQVLTLAPQDVPVTMTWVGTTVGDINAEIRAQVEGYLQLQAYRNGTLLSAGDLMFQIDPRPFEAALAQAEGTFAEANAQLKRDYLNAKRATELYEQQVISTEEFDDTTQQYMVSKAAAATAQAAVDAARLNLEFTRITSPVDGVSSIATTQVGDLVGPSSGVLATVTRVDPIKVEFAMAEQEYLSFVQQFFDHPEDSPVGKVRTDGPPLTLQLADGTIFPHQGRISAVNNAVGVNTGSLVVEGLFPNPGSLLRAGQFGLVRAVVRTIENAIVVPNQAIIDLQGTKQVAVVGPDNKVQIRIIKPGPQIDQTTIVKSGVGAGETIIVTGVQKAKDGELVTPQPMPSPSPSPSPTPMTEPSAAAPGGPQVNPSDPRSPSPPATPGADAIASPSPDGASPEPR